MRSGCGRSLSWTSSSAWTRWRNLSGPQPPCYPVWQRFPWTKHQHHTTGGKCCLLTHVHRVFQLTKQRLLHHVWGAVGQVSRQQDSHIFPKLYLSRQSVSWACSFLGQPHSMCYKAVRNLQSPLPDHWQQFTVSALLKGICLKLQPVIQATLLHHSTVSYTTWRLACTWSWPGLKRNDSRVMSQSKPGPPDQYHPLMFAA